MPGVQLVANHAVNLQHPKKKLKSAHALVQADNTQKQTLLADARVDLTSRMRLELVRQRKVPLRTASLSYSIDAPTTVMAQTTSEHHQVSAGGTMTVQIRVLVSREFDQLSQAFALVAMRRALIQFVIKTAEIMLPRLSTSTATRFSSLTKMELLRS